MTRWPPSSTSTPRVCRDVEQHTTRDHRRDALGAVLGVPAAALRRLGVHAAVQAPVLADVGERVDVGADVAAGDDELVGGGPAVGTHGVAVAADQRHPEPGMVRRASAFPCTSGWLSSTVRTPRGDGVEQGGRGGVGGTCGSGGRHERSLPAAVVAAGSWSPGARSSSQRAPATTAGSTNRPRSSTQALSPCSAAACSESSSARAASISAARGGERPMHGFELGRVDHRAAEEAFVTGGDAVGGEAVEVGEVGPDRGHWARRVRPPGWPRPRAGAPSRSAAGLRTCRSAAQVGLAE